MSRYRVLQSVKVLEAQAEFRHNFGILLNTAVLPVATTGSGEGQPPCHAVAVSIVATKEQVTQISARFSLYLSDLGAMGSVLHPQPQGSQRIGLFLQELACLYP